MYERTTKVDEVLKIVGIVIIALSAIGGFIVLSIAAGSYVTGSMFSALASVAPGIIAGILFIGFAAIIRLLDQIRGQGEIMLKRLGGAAEENGPGSEELPQEIVENPDGTFTVEGKTYDSLANARAYLEFLEGLRT